MSRSDVELAAAALRKRAAGGKLTRAETAAIGRVQKAEEETQRWRHYRSIPKKHYRQMSGRSARTLLDQAALYGIPLSGPTVDLSALLRWLHDFLATHKVRLRTDLSEGASTPALERWREEKARMAELDRRQREGELLRRDQVHDGLGEMAGILRQLGETAQRQFGPAAHELVNEALDDWTRKLDTVCGSDGNNPLPG